MGPRLLCRLWFPSGDSPHLKLSFLSFHGALSTGHTGLVSSCSRQGSSPPQGPLLPRVGAGRASQGDRAAGNPAVSAVGGGGEPGVNGAACRGVRCAGSGRRGRDGGGARGRAAGRSTGGGRAGFGAAGSPQSEGTAAGALRRPAGRWSSVFAASANRLSALLSSMFAACLPLVRGQRKEGCTRAPENSAWAGPRPLQGGGGSSRRHPGACAPEPGLSVC